MAPLSSTATGRDSPSSALALHHDGRGAMMIVGLFMCCILASLVWYLLGIGEAILWRDRGQEVADTLALTSASCHARGMNIISFLNLVMLLLTAVFMVLKLIDAILVVVSVILAFIPGAQGAGTAAFNAHRTLEKGITQLERFMERTFPWLGSTQKWVAIGAPWWGEASSSAVATKYSTMGHEHNGVALSFSLLPVDWLARLPVKRSASPGPVPVTYDPGGARPRTFQLPQELFGRYGLPVSADKYNSLCTASMQAVADMGYQAMKSMGGGVRVLFDNPGFRSALGGAIRFATYTLKEGACRGPFWKSGQYIPPDTRSQEKADKEQVDADCSDAALRRRVEELEKTAGPPDPGPRPPSPGPEPGPNAPAAERARWQREYNAYTYDWPGKKDTYDQFWSVSAQRQRFKDLKAQCQGKTPFSQDDVIAAQRKNRDRGPKLMVNYAINGNDWMQVWAFAFGDPPGDETAREILKVVPKVMREAVSDTPSVERANYIYFAQSEFYLDCKDKWFTGCNNFQLATFKLAWRARLRRVKQPDFFADIVTMLLGNVMGSDWFRDKARGRFAVLNKLGGPWTNTKNLGSNIAFGWFKTEILYETNLMVGHGNIYKAGLH